MNGRVFLRASALVVSLSVLVSLGSCSLFGPKPEEIVEAADTFADALLSRDVDELRDLTSEKKSSKTMKTFEELFDDSAYSFEQNKFNEAVADTITYEVDASSVEISKDVSSVDVVFTLVDYEIALSDGEFSDINQVVSAVGSCDEVIDYTITFEFVETEEGVFLLSNLKDKHFAGLFSFCTYEFEIKPDLASLMEGTDIWSDDYSICMTTTFNGDLSNVISDVTFDVYLDGEIVSQDASVFYYEGFVYCNYDNDDYSELASGEYEIRLKYEGEEICSSSVTIDKPVTYPSRSDSDLIRVGIVNNDPNESGYRTANDMDLKQMFTEENGYEASFFYSLRNDDQIQGAENFIYEGVDYLLISPADTSGWDTVVEDAYNAGIKVIFFDRLADADPSYYLTYVHPDTYLAALEAVDWLSDQRLSEYNIVHLQGVLGSSAQMGRTAPLDEMVAAYGNWNYVTQQTAEWDTYLAEDIVENVIASGEDFNVIYAENDTMAQGAVAALDAAGISHGLGGDVIVVSFDCYEWALEEVLAGSWNYDQQCNPFQASYIDAVIKDMEAGILPPSEVIVDDMGFDAATITASDVDDYGI